MYQALYRKWRPLTFDDVISQPSITTTLKNQLITKKTAHAYLFTGSRGTGKTTCARILAKAINCKNVVGGNPCLKCDICIDAENNGLADIIEIDAASNNGVDDIRSLREAALYTPERCEKRVYIIDEVHMLSTSAFNALLKIMEEPPPHVVFILATTEVHKVPATILSRCQRFDFRRILADDISNRLEFIAAEEKVKLSSEAASLISRIADGGMRDALSLLDQCIAYSDDITTDGVSLAAGISGRDYLFRILGSIVSSNPSEAIEIIDELYAMSKDMQKLCEELISQFRNLMLIKTIPSKTDLILCMPSEISELQKIAEQLPLPIILEKLTTLQECNVRMTKSLSGRIELEMCLIKICDSKIHKPVASVENSDLLEKIKSLEERLNLAGTSIAAGNIANSKTVAVPKMAEPPVSQAVDFSKLKAEDFKPCGLWIEVLEEFEKVCPSVSGTLKNSRAFVNGDVMLINSDNQFFIQLFKKKENAAALGEVVKDVLGKTYIIRAKSSAPIEKSDNKASDLITLAKGNNIPTQLE